MKGLRPVKAVSAAIAIGLLPGSNAVLFGQQALLPDAPKVHLLAQATQAADTTVQSQSNPPQPPAATGPKLTLAEAERTAIAHNPSVSIAHLLQLAQGQVVREARSAELPDAQGDLTAVDAHADSRITAGALNNPIVYERAAGGLVITVEDHYAHGGLGDSVLAALANERVRTVKLAVREIARSGKPKELMEMFGISSSRIVEAVRTALG